MFNRRTFLIGASCAGFCSIAGTGSMYSSSFKRPLFRLGATTTLRDSGLLQALTAAFTARHDIDIRTIVRGTGEVLTLAKRGDVDALLIHDPAKEREFARQGFVKSDQIILENRFVLVGPKGRIPAADRGDILPALKAIHENKIPFVSRGDASGTHAAELRLWAELGLNPSTFANSWYWECGAGMGATLNIAASANRTTLTDLATWEFFNNKNQLTKLADSPANPLSSNVYSYLTLNKHATSTTIPETFGKWLTSPSTQTMIENFRINGQKVFFTPIKPLQTAAAELDG